MIKQFPKTGKVRFEIEHPDATSVALLGDFNEWDRFANPMKQQSNGRWRAELNIDGGSYHFRYLVNDEIWLNDDDAPQVENPFGSDDSVLEISTEVEA